jgi:hypothetical protein
MIVEAFLEVLSATPKESRTGGGAGTIADIIRNCVRKSFDGDTSSMDDLQRFTEEGKKLLETSWMNKCWEGWAGFGLEKAGKKDTLVNAGPLVYSRHPERFRVFLLYGIRDIVRKQVAGKMFTAMNEDQRRELSQYWKFDKDAQHMFKSISDTAETNRRLVMQQIAFPVRSHGLWTEENLQCVTAGNVRENAIMLRDMRLHLEIIGLPLRAWLLERDEHLYTYYGIETYEPVLSRELIVRVAEALWSLCASMYGGHPITYETLAAQVREPDVQRVSVAVRRLGICTRHDGKGADSCCYTVQYASNHCWWVPRCQSETDRHALGNVVDTVGRLADPVLAW